MSDFSADGFPEFEWDDRGELLWSESSWQGYLKTRRQEVQRFLGLYENLRHRGDHLDEIAREMGWDREDWGVPESSEDPDLMDEATEPEMEDFEPYTLHRHPVYIVTFGLYQVIRHRFKLITRKLPQALTADFAVQLTEVLHRGENNAVLAIQAQDLGDYALTICHLKSALTAINEAFRLLQSVPVKRYPRLEDFCQDTTSRLFDLRELWLRVMQDCRIEIDRRNQTDQG